METGKEQVIQVYFGGADAFNAKLAECQVKNLTASTSTVSGTRLARDSGKGQGIPPSFAFLQKPRR